MAPYVNIDAEVERLFRYAGRPRMANGIAIDVVALVRQTFDLDVAYIDGLTIRGQRLLGALVPERKLLLVEAGDIAVRQRFTVAHECAHWVLHYQNAGSPSLFDVASPLLFSCGENDVATERDEAPWRRRREILANQFAARLLMPAALCREVFQREVSLDRCAHSLFVSKEACGIRLRELGLIL